MDLTDDRRAATKRAEDAFTAFLDTSERRLRVALIAAYGAEDGRAATVDALSWAWEHWDRLSAMTNPVGYLFRVGQTAARRARSRPFPLARPATQSPPADAHVEPDLAAALVRLSEQQRLVVLLVHAFGWTFRETAEALDLAPSTVQTHSERGLARLRSILEVTDADRH